MNFQRRQQQQEIQMNTIQNKTQPRKSLIRSQEINWPQQKTIKKLIFTQSIYERKKYIFFTVNTVTMSLTIFNMLSILNIEAQSSLKMYEQTQLIKFNDQNQGFTIYYFIFILILVHLLKLFTCLIGSIYQMNFLGYFSIYQKSERLLTYYMLLNFVTIISRGIITILIVINFQQVELLCDQIFGYDGDDTGTFMAIQFVIILLVFVVIELFLGIAGLIQGSYSKQYYKMMMQNEQKMHENSIISYQLMLKNYLS